MDQELATSSWLTENEWTGRGLPVVARMTGFAMIDSIACIGGFVSPAVISTMKDKTDSADIDIYVFAAVLVLGAILFLAAIPEHLPRIDR